MKVLKAKDIILQLSLQVPRFTNLFTDEYDINTIVRSGNEFVIKMKDSHNFKAGKAITISGVTNLVDISTFTRVGTVGTIETVSDHDITRSIQSTIVVAGSTNAEFNGTFTVTKILSPTQFTVTMVNSGPSDFGGSGYVENIGPYFNDYNGTYGISKIISPTCITVTDMRTSLGTPVQTGDMKLRARPRISGSINLQRTMDAYTDNKDKGWWMFVMLEDVFASKDRDLRTDSIQDTSNGEHFRQQVIQPFTVYIIKDVTDERAARETRDDVSDLFIDVCRSVLFSRFNSNFGVGEQGNVHFMTHGTVHYDGALYVHAFSFQQTCDLSDRDIVDPSADVSFKKFTLNITPVVAGGTEVEVMQTADVEIIDPL